MLQLKSSFLHTAWKAAGTDGGGQHNYNVLSDGLKNNIYIIKVHNVTERSLRGKYEATRASILLLFGMKVRGLCKRTVCTKIEVACVCECREGGRRHVSCLRGGCVANMLPRGDLPWPLSARLWGRLLAPPGMQMSGHKTGRYCYRAGGGGEEREMGPRGEWRRRWWWCRGGSALTSQRAHEPKCMKEVEGEKYIYILNIHIFSFFKTPI